MLRRGIVPKGNDALTGDVWFLSVVPNFRLAPAQRASFVTPPMEHQRVLLPIAVLKHRVVPVPEMKFVPMGNAYCPVVAPRFLMGSAQQTNIVMQGSAVCGLVPRMFSMGNVKPERCAAVMI